MKITYHTQNKLFTNKSPKAKGALKHCSQNKWNIHKMKSCVKGISKVSTVFLGLRVVSVYGYHWNLGNRSMRRIDSRLS